MLTNKDQLISGIITPLQSCPLAKPVGSPKKDLQKDFGMHLSKTTLFLVNQTAQHKAVAAINNNKFHLFPPNLDHILKKSSILLAGEIPNKMCTARHKNLAYKQSKKRC
jgi:hypothetical protein